MESQPEPSVLPVLRWQGSRGLRSCFPPLTRSAEPICGGLIEGAALVDIAANLVKVFLC